MLTNLHRFLITGLFFLMILLSGYWLSRTGKPYNGLIFNIHKLIAVAAIVLLAIALRRMHQVETLSTIELLTAVMAGLFFLGTIATGGLLSIPSEKTLPEIVHKLHQVTPYLTLFSTAATMYLLKGR